jgi:hypothetical protein
MRICRGRTVLLSMSPNKDRVIPIACNVAAIDNRSRYDMLSNLLRAAISGRAELPDGFAFSLNGGTIGLAELGEWISLERQCCPFLNFELSVSGTDSIWWLTLTGPDGSKALLDHEFPA